MSRRNLAHRCLREYRDGGDSGKLVICGGRVHRGWTMAPTERLAMLRVKFCDRCRDHWPCPKSRAIDVVD